MLIRSRMSRIRKWLAEVGRRLLAGRAGSVPVMNMWAGHPIADLRRPRLRLSAFERRKLRGFFPY